VHCDTLTTVTIWDSINPSVDPELKHQLLAGDLTVFTCSRCGLQVGLDYDVLYHDMDGRFVVWYRGDSQERSQPSMPEPMALHMMEMLNEYTRRLVFHQQQLIEKIHVFDASLDDRIVEIVKAIALPRLLSGTEPPEDRFLFHALEGTGSEKQLEFVVVDNSDAWSTVEFPFDEYRNIADAVLSNLNTAGPGAPGWATVGRTYAQQLLTSLE